MPGYKYRKSQILEANVIGSNITKYRLKAGMSQEDLALNLSKTLRCTDILSPQSISAYENGTKLPPTINLIGIALTLGVTLDELVGMDNIRTIPVKEENEVDKETADLFAQYDFELKAQQYEDYDRKPVYVVSKIGKFTSQWGVMDYTRNCIVTPELMIPISQSIKVFRHRPVETTFIDLTKFKAHDLQSLMKAKVFWVSRIDSTVAAKSLYDGWYRHNENYSMIINMANGLTLPYNGLGISYSAFDLSSI